MAKNALAKLWNLALRSNNTRYSKAPITAPTLSAVVNSASQITVTASGSASSLGTIAGYLWYRDGVLVSETPGASPQVFTGLAPTTQYQFTAQAVDSAGNRSAVSAVASATTSVGSDVTPPTIPASLSVSVLNSTMLRVVWLPSSDPGGSGIDEYRLERSTTGTGGWSEVASPEATSFDDSGLTPNTRYYYRVRALDLGGNASGYSNVSSAVTAASETTIQTTMQSSITQFGITWTFAQSYPVGQFANGDYFVVDSGSGVVVSSVSPTPTTGRNGSQVNPTVGGRQGLDSRSGEYNASLAVTFPRALAAGDSMISSISVVSGDRDWDNSTIDSHVFVSGAAVLTVMSASPPVGTMRPAYVDRSQTLYNANQINQAVLPRLSTSGMPSPASQIFGTPLNRMKRGLERPWLLWPYNFQARDIHPAQNMYGYHRAVGEFVSDLASYLISDHPIDDTLLIRTVQLGIDYYHVGLNGNGDSAFWCWPILFTGKLLGNQDMLNAFLDGDMRSTPRDYPDFYWMVDKTSPYTSQIVPEGRTYSIGGINYKVGFKNNTAPASEYEHLDPSEWGLATEASKDDGYRTGQDSHPHVGMVLSARVMNLMTEWNHPETFAYIDRWMTEAGHSTRSGSSFTDAMWNAHRNMTAADLNLIR